MADLALIRVDSRLIHGQVVTRWVKQLGAKRVYIVDDELKNDPFLTSVFMMATPQGTKLEIASCEEAGAAFQKDKLGEGVVFVLFKSIDTAKAAYDAGFHYESLQVAGLGAGPNKKVVYRTVSLDTKDAENLVALSKSGVRVFIQTIHDEKQIDLKSIMQKHYPEVAK